MSRANKSHVPYTSGVPHPFTGMAEAMVASHGGLMQIRDFVRENSNRYTPAMVDFAALKQKMVGNGMMDELRAIVRQTLEREPKKPAGTVPMPKPPPAVELYGRIEKNAEILDIGSGTAKRLIQFSGQFKPTTLDQECPSTRIDAPHEHKTFSEPDERMTVSCMSLTNNKDISAFRDTDGVHLVPNVEELHLAGVSTLEDGAYTTIVKRHGMEDIVYVDYVPDLPTTPINPFFNGINTYRERGISIKVGAQVVGRAKPAPSLGNRCTTMPEKGPPLTLKYHGVLMRYKRKDGKSYMLSRDGDVAETTDTGDVVDMDLWLENTIHGPKLLRVNLFRGVTPYHSAAALHQFCDRIKVLVDGKPLMAPELFEHAEQLARPDVEGLVYRECGTDFLIRNHASIDVHRDDLPGLLEELLDAGLNTTHVDPAPVMENEVIEYEVQVDGNNCKLVLIAVRDKTPDPPKKIREFLSWPTTRDFLADVDCGIPGLSREYLKDEPDSDCE